MDGWMYELMWGTLICAAEAVTLYLIHLFQLCTEPRVSGPRRRLLIRS